MAKSTMWKAHLPRLFEEILANPSCGILRQPLLITNAILKEVAERAIELNDPKLHALMLRLALYEQGDPHSAAYDPSLLEQLEEAS